MKLVTHLGEKSFQINIAKIQENQNLLHKNYSFLRTWDEFIKFD